MKALTREDWLNDPTPRMMWVWDDTEEDKKKRLVVHHLTCKGLVYSFVAEEIDGREVTRWKHCAEIEEPQSRRMTNYELAKWLYEGASCGEFRECKYSNYPSSVYSHYYYGESFKDESCPYTILIRVNGGEWHEPLIEVEE